MRSLSSPLLLYLVLFSLFLIFEPFLLFKAVERLCALHNSRMTIKRTPSADLLANLQLKSEAQLLAAGIGKDDVPMDTSEEFYRFCEACRRGDLRGVGEGIAKGVNLNARDEFDYTPLILVRSI